MTAYFPVSLRSIFFVKLFVLCVAGTLTASAETAIYVSVAGENKIVLFHQNAQTGALKRVEAIPVPSESGGLTVSRDRKYLYASLRPAGKLASYAIASQQGHLKWLQTIDAAADPAFLSTDQTGKYLLTAYYVAGKVAVHPIRSDGTLDEEKSLWIDTADKAHAILADPQNQFVFVPHTGPNRIFQFHWNSDTGQLLASQPASLFTGPNTGPRQLAYHPQLDIVYFDNEQGSSVSAYHLDRRHGTLKWMQTLSTIPDTWSESNSCARMEIHPSGKFLYASNRGHDSIAGFAIKEDGSLTALGQFPTEKTPRGFTIDPAGRFLYAAGEGSGKLASYRIDQQTGELIRMRNYHAGARAWWVLAVDLPR